ncbi:MAG: hypothetical protein KAI47_14870, partial [Deltaproteobacteria bacterium]|nr:hypothetical protein [Deltaproteobacteria bacterium]
MTGPRHRNQAPRPTLGRHALLTLALGTFFLASCSVDILHDLDEPTANTVLAALQKRGVSPEKER